MSSHVQQSARRNFTPLQHAWLRIALSFVTCALVGSIGFGASASAADKTADSLTEPPAGTPPKDPHQFNEWLFSDVDLGNPSGPTLLGLSFLKGKGVKQDLVKARELLQKAVELADGCGTTQLGLIYLRGTGVAKNAKKANELLTNATEYGIWYPATGAENNAEAQFELAVAAETGVGLTKEAGNAYQWYKIVSESSSSKKAAAAAKLQEITSRLTPEEKDQYDQQVAIWKENQQIALTPKFSGDKASGKRTGP